MLSAMTLTFGHQSYSFPVVTSWLHIIAAEFLLGPPPAVITLQANANGVLTMIGDSGDPISFSYYEITSGGNSLTTRVGTAWPTRTLIATARPTALAMAGKRPAVLVPAVLPRPTCLVTANSPRISGSCSARRMTQRRCPGPGAFPHRYRQDP